MRFQFLASFILGLTLSPVPTFGCSCVPPPPGVKTVRELAAWTAKRGDVIFEGKVERVELKWKLMEAPIGDVIPAVVDDLDEDDPVMLVSFDVLQSFQGNRQEPMQLDTGIGGGDCGFDFEVGKQHLVYAYKNETGELWTGICSGTALLEKNRANLAYLRGDGVGTAVDKEAPTATNKLCGRVILTNPNDFIDSQVLLFREGSKSPAPHDESEAGNDGSFCVTGVDPGKYHLLFVKKMAESFTSFVYFPGVTKLSEATTIEIVPGQTLPDLVFQIPVQPTFSISGFVSNSDSAHLPAEVKVMLVSTSQPLLTLA